MPKERYRRTGEGVFKSNRRTDRFFVPIAKMIVNTVRVLIVRRDIRIADNPRTERNQRSFNLSCDKSNFSSPREIRQKANDCPQKSSLAYQCRDNRRFQSTFRCFYKIYVLPLSILLFSPLSLCRSKRGVFKISTRQINKLPCTVPITETNISLVSLDDPSYCQLCTDMQRIS